MKGEDAGGVLGGGLSSLRAHQEEVVPGTERRRRPVNNVHEDMNELRLGDIVVFEKETFR